MGSRKGFMKIRQEGSFLSSFKRGALVCVALLMAAAALAVGPAFAGDDETIITAGLSGATLNGQRPSGRADFRQRPGNDLKLEVEVEDVNLPAGTVLSVLVNNQPFGTITLNSLRAGEIERETGRGESVPQVTNGTPVVVTNQAGAAIVSGAFGTNPTTTPTPSATPTPGATPSPTPTATPSPTPTPGATPSPTPTPGATPTPSPTPGATPTPTPANFEIRAHLTGAAIGGVTPTGRADFEVEFGNREFKVRVEDVNLAQGDASERRRGRRERRLARARRRRARRVTHQDRERADPAHHQFEDARRREQSGGRDHRRGLLLEHPAERRRPRPRADADAGAERRTPHRSASRRGGHQRPRAEGPRAFPLASPVAATSTSRSRRSTFRSTPCSASSWTA